MLDVEFEKTKITNNFSSNTTIKEIKQSLKKQMLANNNKNRDNYLIKIYINGKEIKEENIPIGTVIEGDKGDMLMACLTLTDEIVNDEKKIYENLIKNLSKNCSIHTNNKAINICLNCSNSICDVCIPDHSNHKIICKKEIINYENNLMEVSNFFEEKFNEMGVLNNNSSNKNKLNTKENLKEKETSNSNNYQELYFNLRLEISKQCEMILNLVEEIKKKEIQLLNNFKMDIDPTLPNILDYRDKINDLIFQITENKKEKILRNDSEFIEFYLKYLQLNNINEKSKQNLINIKNTVDKYKEIIFDFKLRNDHIIKAINENMDKIRCYDINLGNPLSCTSLNNNNVNFAKSDKAGFNNNMNNSNAINNNVNNNLATFNSNNNFKNENLNIFNSINKNDYNNNNLNNNLANFNSNNNINERGRATTPINYNNVLTYSNNNELNSKQQNDYQSNNFNNINGNNSFHYSHNNFHNSSKLNLINLLGSSGKTKNNLIKSINRVTNSKSPTNMDQSLKNFSSINNNNLVSNINTLSNNQNKSNNNKSFQNMQIEEESPINLLNEQKEDMFIIQSKIITTQINTKNILVFDNNTNQVNKKEIDFSEVPINKFESNQSTLNYNNKFYISGGSGFYSANLFFELDTENFKLKRLNDMLFKHPFHSLLGGKNAVFAISGFNSKKVEKFDLKNLSWSELPELNEPRSFPNCLILENKYIYVFGGLIESLNKSNLNVERINLNAPSANMSWEKLEICFSSLNNVNLNSNQNSNLNVPFYSGLIRTSKDKFLLLGGKQEKDLVSSLDVFVFNLKENIFEESSELRLPSADEFQGKNFLKFDSNKFAQFSGLNQNKLYIYDENENNFEILEFKS